MKVTILLLLVAAYSWAASVQKNKGAAIGEVDDQVVTFSDNTPSTNDINPFPEQIPIAFTAEDGQSVSFILQKNNKIDPSLTPMKIDDPTLDGDIKQALKTDKKCAFYISNEYDADFSVKIKNKGGTMTRVMKGNLLVDGERYRLRQENDGEYHIRKLHHEKNDPPMVEVDDETFGTLPSMLNLTMIGENGELIEEQPNLAPNSFKGTGRRRKRSAGVVQFDIEIKFILDHTIYEYWLEENNGNHAEAIEDINVVYNGIMNGMQKAYLNIDAQQYGVRIIPRLVELQLITQKGNSGITTNAINLCTTNPPSSPRDCNVDSSLFFTSAAEWSDASGRTYKDPDHVMVFTKYDVKGSSVIGVALIAQICDGHNNAGLKGSFSIVEETGFTTWATAAHELGHGLGSRHDGSNGCSANDKHIMAPALSVLDESTIDNAHAFSHCSIQSMANTLMGLNADLGFWNYPRPCTVDKDYPNEVGAIGQLPGERFSLEEQCVFGYGEGYTPYDIENSNICVSLRCIKNGWWYSGKYAADGTECAPGKYCLHGHCVQKETTQQTSTPETVAVTCSEPPASCQDKASYTFTFNGNLHICQDMKKSTPNLCFQYKSVRTNCPRTCHQVMCETEEISPCGVAGGFGST